MRPITLFEFQPGTFDVVWRALLGALHTVPVQRKATAAHRRWGRRSVVGRMLDALFTNPVWKVLKQGDLFSGSLVCRLDEMLALALDDRCYAIVMMASRLRWIFHIDARWSEARIAAARE